MSGAFERRSEGIGPHRRHRGVGAQRLPYTQRDGMLDGRPRGRHVCGRTTQGVRGMDAYGEPAQNLLAARPHAEHQPSGQRQQSHRVAPGNRARRAHRIAAGALSRCGDGLGEGLRSGVLRGQPLPGHTRLHLHPRILQPRAARGVGAGGRRRAQSAAAEGGPHDAGRFACRRQRQRAAVARGERHGLQLPHHAAPHAAHDAAKDGGPHGRDLQARCPGGHPDEPRGRLRLRPHGRDCRHRSREDAAGAG